MSHKANHPAWAWQLLFALLALVVPSLVAYTIYDQIRTPAFVLSLDWQTGRIKEVPPGSLADTAGFWPGDIVLSVGGLPLSELSITQIENLPVEIERDGQPLTLELPVVSFVSINLSSLLSGALVALIYWGVSVLLILRRFQQKEIRLVFFPAQTLAITLLFPLAYMPNWYPPFWALNLSTACLFLSAPLILHHCITFPVTLGAPRQRRWVMGPLYALAFLAIAACFHISPLGKQLGVLYTIVIIAAATVVVAYVYLRRAWPDDRRRLRLIVLSTLLAAIPPLLFYLGPNLVGYPGRMPLWLVGLFAAVAPLSYLYAIMRHNLFGIDRLLNRTLVYAILSLGILLLYLGPFLLIYRFRPDDLLAQMIIAAGLTLLVGLSFEWTRARVQRWVDLFFYGGWYDYPGVVEKISDALARCVEREQLAQALTAQVPTLMQLRQGQLWISEVGPAPLPKAIPPQLEFSLDFQNQARGVWIVEPRRDGEELSDADVRILETLARQAETALGNVLLVETLRRQLAEIRASRETLAQAQRQLLRSREEERARLARELHDGPLQALVGLNLQLGLLLPQEDEGSSPPAQALAEMRAQVRELLVDLRQVCAELRPPMLDTLGLGAALQALAEEWSSQNGVNISLDLPADAALRSLRSLPTEVSLHFYRVAQEALTNIARHAVAQHVALSLSGDPAQLILSIKDNGRGFALPPTPGDLTAHGHFGLVGMQERVDLIGGQLAVKSFPGRGTCIRITWQTKDQQPTTNNDG